MDSDGFAIQGARVTRRVGSTHRGQNLDTFFRDTSRYPGTAEDFTNHHKRSYGIAERLGPDGSHPPGRKPTFPRNDDREKAWKKYKVRTKAANTAHERYDDEMTAVEADYGTMDETEQEYYLENNDGLRPDHHERLHPRAVRWADNTYNMATGREGFLHAYPHGYHTLHDQNYHYDKCR